MMVSSSRDVPISACPPNQGRSIPSLLILIFILGLVIRLFACQYVYIINQDGALYIHQARAITYGEWNDLTTCSMPYLSIYPVLISLAHVVFHNWVVAARAVSVFFGFLTLVALYFLMRRFFDKQTSSLTTLILAVMPVFVDGSADLIRGPVYWFFVMTALALFVTHMDKKNYASLLLASSVCFLLAAWARMEALLFIAISCGFLLLAGRENRLIKLAFFAGPLVLLFLFSMSMFISLDLPAKDLLRTQEIGRKLYEPTMVYAQLRADLKALGNQPNMQTLHHFLKESRHLVWFIALGTLLSHLVKAFFYPFFLVFLIGMGRLWSGMRNDRRVRYLTLLSAGSFILLYAHILQTWIVAERFLALFILPSFVFMGFGLESIKRFAQSRFRLRETTAVFLICFIILAVALPKNLKPREKDKLVFKEIGEFIANREGNKKVNWVAAPMHTVRWVSFYANLGFKGAACPQPYSDLTSVTGNSYHEFLQNLKARGIPYVLWAERQWPKEHFDFIREVDSGDFLEMGRWSHPDTGSMVLFKLR